MDNHHFNIVAEDGLQNWVSCAVGGSGHEAVGWAERESHDGIKRLVFYWTHPSLSSKDVEAGYTKLPYPHNAKQIYHIMDGWLEQVKYGCEPDQDGHNKKGFRLYNDEWGHVDNCWEAFVAISPAWAMYGK